MQNAGCKIEAFPSEMDNKYFNFVREADTFILHFTSYILHFVVANNNSFLAELVLTHAAQGALEALGDVLPLGAGGNAALGIASFHIVGPAANIANVLHSKISFRLISRCFPLLLVV